MTDAEVIAAIQSNHLRANIAQYEDRPEEFVVHWDKAWVDRGGTIFGPGPYLKVPVTEIAEEFDIVIRVYAPERLRRKLANQWARP